MTDVHTPEQRSYNMSRIRGKWTKPEKDIHYHLKSMKVKHKMHPKIEGNPDVYLKGRNFVMFIDGCFWHGCPKHCHIPETRKSFWEAKIRRNKRRDRKHTRDLKRLGYYVIRLWECDTENITQKTL